MEVSSLLRRIFAFIRFVKFESGLDIVAVRETAQPLCLGKGGAAVVAPAALRHKLIPNLDLLLSWSPPLVKTPGQDLFIGAAAEDPLRKGIVLDVEKSRAAGIEPGPDLRAHIIFLWQFAGGMQTDLVEHASEVNHPADLFVRTAQTRDFHM